MEAVLTHKYNWENSWSFTFMLPNRRTGRDQRSCWFRPGAGFAPLQPDHLAAEHPHPVQELQLSGHLHRLPEPAGPCVLCRRLRGGSPGPLDMDMVLESLKCLGNLELSIPQAQVLAAEACLVLRLAQHVGLHGESIFPHEVQVFDLHLLSLLTALCSQAHQQLLRSSLMTCC